MAQKRSPNLVIRYEEQCLHAHKSEYCEEESADYKVATNLSWHQNYCFVHFGYDPWVVSVFDIWIERGTDARAFIYFFLHSIFWTFARCVHLLAAFANMHESTSLKFNFVIPRPFCLAFIQSLFCIKFIQTRVMGVNFNYKNYKNFANKLLIIVKSFLIAFLVKRSYTYITAACIPWLFDFTRYS